MTRSARRSARLVGLLLAVVALGPSIAAQQGKRFFAERHVRMSLNGHHGADSVALADLDGDGRLDVVTVADYSYHEVAVALQTADGGFALPVAYDVGEVTTHQQHQLAIGDLDLDGHLDVVTANDGFNNLTVLLNDGTGALDTSFTLATGLFAGPVAIADLDDNGWPDLLVAGGDSLAVLSSSGGIFAPPVQYPAAPDADEFRVHDVDGDGALDVLVVSGGALTLLPGDGFGGFGAPVTVTTLTNAWAMDAGDLDGDGFLDVVVAHFPASLPAVDVLLGDGSGGFATASSTPLEANAYTLGLADLDLDGDLDVVAAGYFLVMTLMGDGDGGLAAAGSYPLSDATTTHNLALGDVDGDGRIDLLLTSAAAAAMLLHGDGLGGFLAVPEATLLLEADPVSPVLGDLDGDGHLDAVVLHTSQDLIRVSLGDGAGGLTFAGDHALGGGQTPHQVLLAELTGDGALDLVAADRDGPLAGLHLLVGDGAGGFAPAVHLGDDIAANAVAAGDVDGDGDLDLVMGRYLITPALRILENDGTGGFGLATDLAVGGSADSILIEDFDLDGEIDIATSTAIGGSQAPKIAYGDGLGGWESGVSTPLPAGTYGLRAFDANGDGLLDLLTRTNSWYYAHLSLATAPREYAEPVSIQVSVGQLRDLRVADLDADGNQDLVAVSSRNGIAVLPGDGTGAFDTARHYGSAEDVTGLAVGDLFEDGKPDLVVTSDGVSFSFWFEPRLTVHRNLALSVGPWQDLGAALAGSIGQPVLSGGGTLGPASQVSLAVSGARPGGSATLAIGPVSIDLPFKGGIFVPLPLVLVFGLPLDAAGTYLGTGSWYGGLPPGTETYFQAWIADPAGPAGFAATNALRGTTP